MGRLDGKVAIVTGGARGNGLACARAFVAEGARVVLADVLDDDGTAAAKEIGDAGHYVHLDVSSEQDWARGVAEAEERFGPVSVLFNNAGILAFSALEKESLEQYERIIRVNQVGVFLGMRALVGSMKRAGGGSIINVASVEGMRGGYGLAAYSASKFAVRGMTKVAAMELGKHGIRVNAVCPGAIDTPMTRGQGLDGLDVDALFGQIPAGRMGRPEDLTGMVVFLASDESAFCTGADFIVDGGATSFIGWGGPLPKP